MTALCQFQGCVSHPEYLVRFRCLKCPSASRDHEETLCTRHTGRMVRDEARCSFCKGSITVTNYDRLAPSANHRAPAAAAVEQRITDADRNRTIELLGEAFAVGKLTKDEFDLRADRASVAKVQSDLDRELSDVKSSDPMRIGTEQQGNNLVRANVLMGVLLAICVIAAMVAILV